MDGSSDLDTKHPNNALFLLPAKKRLDFIINHPSPLELVRSLRSPDLLMIIREVGAEDCLELFSLLNPAQVQEIFDLELWSGDELNIKAASHYFSVLFAASQKKAVSQIHGLDIELLGLMFKRAADIYDLSLGEEPEDFLGPYSVSPDGRFMVCFSEESDKKGLCASLHLFLENLYGRDMSFVMRLLESIRFELPSLLEEESLKWRNHRLLDMGLLPREERLLFFTPLSRRESLESPKKNHDDMHISESLMAFRMDDTIGNLYPFLKTGLKDCSVDDKTRFFKDLAHVGINMFASLSGDFGDREEQNKVFEYVKFLAELGLFQASNGRIEDAAFIISETSVTYLVRLGRSALVALRKRLIIPSKKSYLVFGRNYCHADSPLREVARALTLPEPRFFEGLYDPSKLIVRYFSSINEVHQTMEAINELMFRAALVGRNGLDSLEEIEQNETLSHSNIFARALVNSYLGRAKAMATLSSTHVQKIFDKDFRISADFSRYAKEFSEKIAQKMASSSSPEDPDVIEQKTHRFLTTVLIQMEQNWQLVLGD